MESRAFRLTFASAHLDQWRQKCCQNIPPITFAEGSKVYAYACTVSNEGLKAAAMEVCHLSAWDGMEHLPQQPDFYRLSGDQVQTFVRFGRIGGFAD